MVVATLATIGVLKLATAASLVLVGRSLRARSAGSTYARAASNAFVASWWGIAAYVVLQGATEVLAAFGAATLHEIVSCASRRSPSTPSPCGHHDVRDDAPARRAQAIDLRGGLLDARHGRSRHRSDRRPANREHHRVGRRARAHARDDVLFPRDRALRRSPHPRDPRVRDAGRPRKEPMQRDRIALVSASLVAWVAGGLLAATSGDAPWKGVGIVGLACVAGLGALVAYRPPRAVLSWLAPADPDTIERARAAREGRERMRSRLGEFI